MPTLVVFVKQPTPGRVKTRLAVELGPERAADLYAAFTRDLLDRVRDVGERRVLYFAPNDEAARDHFGELAGTEFELVPQPDVSLGERLEACFGIGTSTRPDRQRVDGVESDPSPTVGVRGSCGADVSSEWERIVAIGSDSPHLPTSHLIRAFELLDDHDCVLGPATDGGYYLVGLREGAQSIFDEIDWSGPRVLGQTVDRVAAAGMSLGLLPPWYDVDTLDDLRALIGHLRAMRVAGEPVELPATERLLAELRLDEPSA